jgi:hypothetical protein
MAYVVRPLDAAAFRPLFGLDAAALAARGALPCIADAKPGYPCRVTLRDAEPGERLILLNHEHLPGDGPFRSRHAIFVLDGAETAAPVRDTLPPMLAERLLSIRAFDARDMMRDADVCEGRDAQALVLRLLEDPEVAYLHVHAARRGCFLARIERD